MNQPQATPAAAAFVATLLHGVTGAHMLHFQQKGQGSYARHMALGTLYEELGGLVDTVTEEYQGCYGIIPSYPSEFTAPQHAITYVEGLYDYVAKNRKAMGSESHIQNSIDSIASLLATTLYKLKNLG